VDRRNSMSKTVTAIVILILLFSAAAGLTPSTISGEEANSKTFTHTVFGEAALYTMYPYDRYAAAALDSIYAQGQYPFYYVSLVDDKNTHAAARNVEYNVNGFPTVFFDGGYQVCAGAWTNIPQMVSLYTSTIIQCGDRAVPDIDASLSVTWLGNATMNIKVTVQNNEASNYHGRIRVYVTEIVSTMGWYIGGHPCHFPFLDYAFNEIISVGALSTWQDSTIWYGNYLYDGYGHSFGGITPGK
jgi:hypothetical protein